LSTCFRAEATDVANAVLDGCDGIMLGAETLRGKQPVATVDTILHICKQAEMCFDHRHHYYHLMDVSHILTSSESPPPVALEHFFCRCVTTTASLLWSQVATHTSLNVLSC
jgi:pyruvate kinase